MTDHHRSATDEVGVCLIWGEFFSRHPEVAHVQIEAASPADTSELAANITFYYKDSDELQSPRELDETSQLRKCLEFLGC